MLNTSTRKHEAITLFYTYFVEIVPFFLCNPVAFTQIGVWATRLQKILNIIALFHAIFFWPLLSIFLNSTSEKFLIIFDRKFAY